MTTRCSRGNSRGLFKILSADYRVEGRKQNPTTNVHAVPRTTHQGKATMTVPVSSCHLFRSPKSATDQIMATTLVMSRPLDFVVTPRRRMPSRPPNTRLAQREGGRVRMAPWSRQIAAIYGAIFAFSLELSGST